MVRLIFSLESHRQAIWWLAYAAQQQGHNEEAKLLCERLLAIFEHTLGPAHPNTQAVYKNYADLLEAMKAQ